MYKLNRAAVLPAGVTPQWSVVDISSMTVMEIFSTYRSVVLGLLKPDGSEIFVNMESFQASYATYTNTLAILFQTLGDVDLETEAGFPAEKIGYVKYSDFYQLGYKGTLCRRGFNDDPDYPRDDLTDVELTRDGYTTDLSLLHTHCLTSVNGFYHNSDTDGKRTYIVDGGKSVIASAQANIGFLSFLQVGALTKRSISVDRIKAKATDGKLKDGIEFSIDDDLTNKSVFLVLGGYLVLPEDLIFYASGDKTFQLNINQLPYLERILESKKFMDLSGLKLTKSDINPNSVNVDEVWSDDVLKRYMTLPQSFLVIIDTPSIAVRKIHIRHPNIPGLFITNEKPTYPLIAGFGRVAEYWSKREDGAWSNIAMDTFRRNYIFNRQSESTLKNVSDQLAPDKPFTLGQIFLLEISTLKGLT